MLATKTKQVILKVKSRKEMEVLKDILNAEDSLKEMISVNVLRRTREEFLILSVDKEVDKAMIVALISKILDETQVVTKYVESLTERLKYPALFGQARTTLK